MGEIADPQASPATATDIRRLDSLTGMRFIAAFMVFLFHAASMGVFALHGTENDPFSLTVENMGSLGVSFFFVLSGYVLTWSSRDGDTVGRFWRRRFVKIFPNHAVTFVVSLLLYASITAAVAPAVLNVTLLHAWVPDVDYFLSFNFPTWSLSCEFLFYLLFPFLLMGVRRIRPQRLWWWAAGTVLLIVAVPLIARLLPTDPTFQARWMRGPDFTESVYQYWFIYVFPPVRLLDFLLGILMARIVIAGRWPAIRTWAATLLVVAGYLASLYVPFSFALNAVTIVPVALLITSTAELDVRAAPSFLRCRPMVWLGTVSFAFYMLHVMVLYYAREQIGLTRFLPAAKGIGWIALMFAITLVAAWLLYAVVERPLTRRWSRAGSADRPAKRPQDAAVVKGAR
ncbi:acyltransferase family protein [Streptomyces hygroscopicus]|uniref:acyltransferase family protein n=1 Tax=Streptomyces hygroscopicus TaxID=1912 RepID=UPI0036BFCD1E